MGLLDQLFQGSDSGGGLLDFLKRNAMNQQFPSGLPSDQAQYGAPAAPMQQPQPAAPTPSGWGGAWPQDNMQWPYGPGGAPSGGQPQAPAMGAQASMQPQAAPMAAPQMAPPQAAPQPQEPNFFNRAADALGSISRGGSMLGAIRGQFDDPRSQGAAQANTTARALVAKGVDPQIAIAAVQPGNTELLKQLVDKHFGAPKPPTALGSGYIYNPQTNKVERAYEPEDKIPAGFAKGDDGNMHFIPGGPADPAYLRSAEAQKKDPNAPVVLGRGGEIIKNNPDGTVTVLHKNQEAQEASVDDKTARFLAEQSIAGLGGKVLVGLGRGAQGPANILKIQKAITDLADERGIDASAILSNVAKQAGLVSSARALGTKETHFGVAEKAMEESLPLAQAASDAVPRSEWMAVNKLVQAGQTQHSNPVLKRFLIATDTAAKDYARTINPTGALRESDIEYARKILSTADGPEAYTAALDQLHMEAGVMHRAIQRQRSELYNKKDDGKGAPAAGGTVKVDGYTIKEH